jgi:hypothetical protein
VVAGKAYSKRKLYTKPINPETSTNEKPTNDHLIKLLLTDGLRDIEKTKKAKIKPTPIATPARAIIGMLEAKYLNPINIMAESSSDMILKQQHA